ncbi:hypothetical protein IJ114_02750 [Candidatus Saccharibacteria bacterium]|nr:hypothetical protein [Candidatus Saccharibacteria bacterium]
MNFYEEVARECKAANIDVKIIEVPSHLKPTSEDYAELERKIALRCSETDRMLRMSELYARNSLPVQ